MEQERSRIGCWGWPRTSARDSPGRHAVGSVRPQERTWTCGSRGLWGRGCKSRYTIPTGSVGSAPRSSVTTHLANCGWGDPISAPSLPRHAVVEGPARGQIGRGVGT